MSMIGFHEIQDHNSCLENVASQLCLTTYNTMDCSLSGFSVATFQAILEWLAILL